MLRQNIKSVQVNIFSMKVDVLNSEDIKVVILVFLSFRSCIVVIVTEVFRLASSIIVIQKNGVLRNTKLVNL